MLAEDGDSSTNLLFDTGRKRRPGTAGKDRYEERRDQGVLVEDGDGSTDLLFDTSRKRWMGTAGRGE